MGTQCSLCSGLAETFRSIFHGRFSATYENLVLGEAQDLLRQLSQDESGACVWTALT